MLHHHLCCIICHHHICCIMNIHTKLFHHNLCGTNVPNVPRMVSWRGGCRRQLGLNTPRPRSRSCSPPRDAEEMRGPCCHPGHFRQKLGNKFLSNKLLAKEDQALRAHCPINWSWWGGGHEPGGGPWQVPRRLLPGPVKVAVKGVPVAMLLLGPDPCACGRD